MYVEERLGQHVCAAPTQAGILRNGAGNKRPDLDEAERAAPAAGRRVTGTLHRGQRNDEQWIVAEALALPMNHTGDAPPFTLRKPAATLRECFEQRANRGGWPRARPLDLHRAR